MAGGWQRYDGQLPTLGSASSAPVWLFVWCKAEGCRRSVYISPDELAAHADRLGENMTMLDFVKRLRCSACGSKDIDSIVDGTGPQKVYGSYPPPSHTPSPGRPDTPPPAPRARKARRRPPRIG